LGLACVVLCVNWAHAQVTVNTQGTVLLHRTEVQYPRALREKGVQGTVTVEATVNPAGEVTDARVLSGPEELRKPVLASVLNWHFAPGAGATRVADVTFEPVEDKRHAEPASVVTLVSREGAVTLQRNLIVAVEPEGLQLTLNSLSRELEEQGTKLAALQNTYSPTHPEVLHTRKQIAEIEERIAA